MNFSVLQWNVWYKERNEHIVAFLKAHPADIVCLQELTIDGPDGIHHAPQYFAQQLNYQTFFQEIDLGPGKITLAVGIFTRFPILQTRSVWINQRVSHGGYDDEPRALVEAVVQVGRKRLRVGTTHTSYAYHFEETPRKMQETDRLIAAVQGHRERFILTGDLNALPGSQTIERLEKFLVNAGPDYAVPTWTTKPFRYEGFEATELRWRLDYVFATPDVRVISSDVLKTDYSDHVPIFTTFEI